MSAARCTRDRIGPSQGTCTEDFARSAQGSCGCDLLFCIASQRSRIGLAQPGCDAQASVTNHLGRHQALRLEAGADAVISRGAAAGRARAILQGDATFSACRGERHVLTLDRSIASWQPAELSLAKAAAMRVSSPCDARCLISHKLARPSITRKETDGPTSWLSELRVRN